MNVSNIEINPKIAHLSDADIETLYDEYISGIKIINLLEKYNIDVTPSGLVKLFPALKLNDNQCPYCETAMYQKRASKSSCSEHDPKCIGCGHVDYVKKNYRWHICRCEGCIDFSLKEAAEKDVRRSLIIAKKYDPASKELRKYEDVKFKDKLSLLSLLLMQSDDKFEFLLSLNDPQRTCEFTPTKKLNEKYLHSLNETGCLMVDPNSRPESFDEESDFDNFHINRVQWLINISVLGKERSSIEEVFKYLYQDLVGTSSQNTEDEVLELMEEIAVEEVLQNVYMRAKELNVVFSAEDKTRVVVKELLATFSVSEIYYFVKKSVESAHLYYQKGGSKNKSHAGNTIPNKILSLGQKSITEKWEPYQYNRHHHCPRSQISKVLYDVLLKDEDAGFSNCIHQYWRTKIKAKREMSDLGNQMLGIRCRECKSKNIEVGMNKQNIEIVCQDCGVTTLFVETV
jgi:hypothetical protein